MMSKLLVIKQRLIYQWLGSCTLKIHEMSQNFQLKEQKLVFNKKKQIRNLLRMKGLFFQKSEIKRKRKLAYVLELPGI